MELCKPSITNILKISCNNNQFSSSPHPHTLFCNPTPPHRHSSLSLSRQGFFLLRSAKSDDTSSGMNRFPNGNVENLESVEERKVFEVHGYGQNMQSEADRDEHGVVVHDEAEIDEGYEEGSLLDVKNKVKEFVDKLNLKFDSEDSSSIALYGISAAAALYLATAVIGALDSIPLFPKLLEVVGLGYSVWFTNRYLLFKQNRDELAAKIEEVKQQVLGSDSEDE